LEAPTSPTLLHTWSVLLVLGHANNGSHDSGI
jgi:hypothetical protein